MGADREAAVAALGRDVREDDRPALADGDGLVGFVRDCRPKLWRVVGGRRLPHDLDGRADGQFQ
jgi:hypothetical protein